jgi:hypothetical protein
MGHLYFLTSWSTLFAVCLCMPLGEYVLDVLVNKSSDLQGPLINPLCFSLQGFVNEVFRASYSRHRLHDLYYKPSYHIIVRFEVLSAVM